MCRFPPNFSLDAGGEKPSLSKPRAPMSHFTSERTSPREESLNFIRNFARLYRPEPSNEQEARFLARLLAQGNPSVC